MLQLYSYYRSSAAFRVRIALALKGLEWETIPVNLLQNEHQQSAYRDKNPQGLIPALATGETLLNQSLAIIEYLEEAYPEPALLPQDLMAKARVRALAYQVAMDIHPINNLRVASYIANDLGQGDSGRVQWLHHWMSTGFNGIEASLQQQGSDGRFCFGDSISLADICLIPQVYNAYRFEVPMDDYPLITAIWQHCTSLPAFIQAAPEAQSDCP